MSAATLKIAFLAHFKVLECHSRGATAASAPHVAECPTFSSMFKIATWVASTIMAHAFIHASLLPHADSPLLPKATIADAQLEQTSLLSLGVDLHHVVSLVRSLRPRGHGTFGVPRLSFWILGVPTMLVSQKQG